MSISSQLIGHRQTRYMKCIDYNCSNIDRYRRAITRTDMMSTQCAFSKNNLVSALKSPFLPVDSCSIGVCLLHSLAAFA